jgi:hypothetical protein
VRTGRVLRRQRKREETMKTLDKSLVLMLALAFSAACAEPQQDRDDDAVPSTEEIGQAIDQTATEFANDTREALDELNAEVDELEMSNADLEGESAAAWSEVQQEIADARQEVENDLSRLGSATAEETDQIHSRIARNLETMTHRVERAKLLARRVRDRRGGAPLGDRPGHRVAAVGNGAASDGRSRGSNTNGRGSAERG